MTIERTKFGLPFLDDAVGGVYLGLPALVKGTRNSGKTVLAAHGHSTPPWQDALAAFVKEEFRK